mmetsp:Transcript_12786/g.33828  ORF Transcript_12786/g.33828 Transcript_12786/m.33828 type:complete len:121 (-) Transcript_12786:497-859(-)
MLLGNRLALYAEPPAGSNGAEAVTTSAKWAREHAVGVCETGCGGERGVSREEGVLRELWEAVSDMTAAWWMLEELPPAKDLVWGMEGWRPVARTETNGMVDMGRQNSCRMRSSCSESGFR